jgi:hypothetical protein
MDFVNILIPFDSIANPGSQPPGKRLGFSFQASQNLLDLFLNVLFLFVS